MRPGRPAPTRTRPRSGRPSPAPEPPAPSPDLFHLDVSTPFVIGADPSPVAPAAEPLSSFDIEPYQAAEEPPAPAASAGSAYADVLMTRSVGSHRDRLSGATDRQAEADGVRPGRRAAVPSWDEIVFGTRRKTQE